MPTRTAALDRVPAPALFVVSGLTQYLGAAIAVGLFAVAGAVEVGWLRIAASALLLLAPALAILAWGVSGIRETPIRLSGPDMAWLARVVRPEELEDAREDRHVGAGEDGVAQSLTVDHGS